MLLTFESIEQVYTTNIFAQNVYKYFEILINSNQFANKLTKNISFLDKNNFHKPNNFLLCDKYIICHAVWWQV